jgi:hypothetical protein
VCCCAHHSCLLQLVGVAELAHDGIHKCQLHIALLLLLLLLLLLQGPGSCCRGATERTHQKGLLLQIPSG